MSESATSPRPLSGAEEFDRRVRSIAQSSMSPTEAMEELARLVGEGDIFGHLRRSEPSHVHDPIDEPVAEPPADFLSEAASYDIAFERDSEAGSPAEPAVVHPPVPTEEEWERPVPRYPSLSVHDLRPVEPSPDAWAQGAEESFGPMPVAERREDVHPEPEGPNGKRTLMVLLAVLVLTGGGLGAALLKHAPTTGAVAESAAATPTIMAAPGPTKIQPETPATSPDAPSEPSTLLDKNKNDGTASAKVVSSVEQPVDLAQAMKPAATAPAAAVPAATAQAATAQAATAQAAPEPVAPPSPFPEPRKVKTILVRPDGSIIADAVAPNVAPASASPSDQQATLAFDPATAIPLPASRTPEPAPDAAAPVQPEAAAPPAAKPPAGSKTTARVPAAKPAASTSQGGSAAAEGRSAVATPKAKPVAHVAKPKPKPVATAATDTGPSQGPDLGPPTLVQDAPAPVAEATPPAPSGPAVTGQGGAFVVQLGAAPTEAEGQATATRLSQKYADDLGGSKALVHKAAAGGRTVFRIRVGNLSQDEAKALCGKVQAGGGACFVARN